MDVYTHVACAGCGKPICTARDWMHVVGRKPYCLDCVPDHEDDDHGLPIAVAEEGS